MNTPLVAGLPSWHTTLLQRCFNIVGRNVEQAIFNVETPLSISTFEWQLQKDFETTLNHRRTSTVKRHSILLK